MRKKAAPARHVDRPRCIGLKPNGERCIAWPKHGTDLCANHTKGANIGRRTKLTPETADLICNALTSGCGIPNAAHAADIQPRSVYKWLRRGEEDLEQGDMTIYAQFVQRTTRTRANVRVTLAAQLRAAARGEVEGDWRAAAWMLERLEPGEFGQRAVVEHEHSGQVEVAHLLGGRQPVDVSRETREKIDALLAAEEQKTIEGTAREVRE